jgi:hypothetical protein
MIVLMLPVHMLPVHLLPAAPVACSPFACPPVAYSPVVCCLMSTLRFSVSPLKGDVHFVVQDFHSQNSLLLSKHVVAQSGLSERLAVRAVAIVGMERLDL